MNVRGVSIILYTLRVLKNYSKIKMSSMCKKTHIIVRNKVWLGMKGLFGMCKIWNM